ncbi:DJ-1/PfpI family protein [Lentzea guizhouensis]|uniref:DJ-1/PfpI family protein n=1 Tax=Lentzea guizhouensis TaxID=1586287 RepID=UPI001C54F27B|nr:DJ-1/PfpI family protein [Lentzea guizhouensis]
MPRLAEGAVVAGDGDQGAAALMIVVVPIASSVGAVASVASSAMRVTRGWSGLPPMRLRIPLWFARDLRGTGRLATFPEVLAMHRIVFVVVAPVFSFDLAIVRMVLDAANGYEIVVCTAEPGRVEAVGGPDVVVDHDLTAVQGADTCVVIGGGGRPTEPGVLDAVRAVAEAGARMAAICTGTFVLARRASSTAPWSRRQAPPPASSCACT